MASLRSLHRLYSSRPTGPIVPTGLSVGPSPSVSASSGQPYSAAATTRRTLDWRPSSFVGPTTALVLALDQMRARSRDEIRNNPYAASACDNFESQVIGNGISPRWNLENKSRKAELEDKFDDWARKNRFYEKQATAAREIFEAGEVFARFYVRPPSSKLRVPLELDLIEGEQCPINLTDKDVKAGIRIDSNNRIVSYRMYKSHPGETALFPVLDMFNFVEVPASEMLHVFKPLRAGMLRGQPHLSSVLTLLHEINKYTDAAVVKKVIQTYFAGFIKKVDPVVDILPPNTGSANSPPPAPPLDPGVQNSRIETGTMQILLPGEDIVFPNLPADSDIETFLSVVLHQFAVGIGATYEQITGDLRGVNLSSIRAGTLDAHRKVEQLQQNVIKAQLVAPVVERWLLEGVLCGELSLPGYYAAPERYHDIDWDMPGWPWLDPVTEAEASVIKMRNGLDSRSAIVASTGKDAATIDAQNKVDHDREKAAGLVYDSNPAITTDLTLTKDGEEMTGGPAGPPPPTPGASSSPGKKSKKPKKDKPKRTTSE